jgi:hypothetical protein
MPKLHRRSGGLKSFFLLTTTGIFLSVVILVYKSIWSLVPSVVLSNAPMLKKRTNELSERPVTKLEEPPRQKNAREKLVGSPDFLDIQFNSIVKGDSAFRGLIQQPIFGKEATLVQLDRETGIVVGGYTANYSSTTRVIQFLNISSQQWMPERTMELPYGVADTHVGQAFDTETRWLYMAGGQKGGGCSPAVTKVVRVHMDTGETEALPPLPSPRYDPGTVITPNSDPSGTQYLHVFGGASETRNMTALTHWRLEVSEKLVKTGATAQWEEVEPVPDSGVHGISFYHDGFIYHSGYCYLDSGMFDAHSMHECQVLAYKQQDTHHKPKAEMRYTQSLQAVGRPSVTGRGCQICHSRPVKVPVSKPTTEC